MARSNLDASRAAFQNVRMSPHTFSFLRSHASALSHAKRYRCTAKVAKQTLLAKTQQPHERCARRIQCAAGLTLPAPTEELRVLLGGPGAPPFLGNAEAADDGQQHAADPQRVQPVAPAPAPVVREGCTQQATGRKDRHHQQQPCHFSMAGSLNRLFVVSGHSAASLSLVLQYVQVSVRRFRCGEWRANDDTHLTPTKSKESCQYEAAGVNRRNLKATHNDLYLRAFHM